jgi:hypothetical protein
MGSFLEAEGESVEMSETPKMKQNVEYVAPPVYVLENLAHQVCQGLGGKYADRELERGFADFLILVSRILAKNLSRDARIQAELMSESGGCKLNISE